MRRRQFIAGVGKHSGMAEAARAQQAGKVVEIGFLGQRRRAITSTKFCYFRVGLRDLGYVKGGNIIIEYRWAEGIYARLPVLATELARSDLDVIITSGTTETSLPKRRPQQFR